MSGLRFRQCETEVMVGGVLTLAGGVGTESRGRTESRQCGQGEDPPWGEGNMGLAGHRGTGAERAGEQMRQSGAPGPVRWDQGLRLCGDDPLQRNRQRVPRRWAVGVRRPEPHVCPRHR